MIKVDEISNILILGAGTMGQQIGFQCAAFGCNVTLYDISQDMLDKSMDRIGKIAKIFVASGRLSENEAEAAIKRIRTESDAGKAGEKADFVSESVPEDPELKGKVFAQFNKLCPQHTIFTTNTSSLLPSMFAEATGRPEQFAAFHFHDVKYNKIVDVMPHPGTSPETTDLIEKFARRIGLVPIVLHRENNGYVFNAMLMEWLNAAQTLAANGVADVRDIDRSWMGVMGTPIGPFGIMDNIGIDTVYKVTSYWAEKTEDPQSAANAEFLKQYVDKGMLGAKTGRGFYKYPAPEFSKPGFPEGEVE